MEIEFILECSESACFCSNMLKQFKTHCSLNLCTEIKKFCTPHSNYLVSSAKRVIISLKSCFVCV